ncbi:site-specific tyrosine recombinase/integron integrase [Candidatus Sneabacter namystus]|uniref:Tyrosine recombinase n=1 Tax=Candidatus Sneabacter namystus TaxID=2601646 RepID=A0A5C0UIY5_9RICK|nr:site-specific tyrosine recombinase/integron integrase [Candidatus Sneabacter namystus]QEK39412.1 tyrosine recombinase [Candidatus Sneabacter namystus]
MFSGYLEQFLESLYAEHGLSENSIIAYKKDIKDFLEYLQQGNIELQTSANTLHEYIVNLSTIRHLSNRSIARKVAAIKHFYRFLISENYCKGGLFEAFRPPKHRIDLPKTLTQSTVQKILATCDKNTSPKGIRTAAIIHLLYATGIRVSELISIKVDDIKNKNCKDELYNLTIIGKGQKERIVLFENRTKILLDKYLSVRQNFISDKNRNNQFLFCTNAKKGHITRQTIRILLKNVVTQANVTESISPHVLRHSFASHMLEQGVDLRSIQTLLGHSDISTTQIYTHIQKCKLKKILEKTHPLAKKHFQNKTT